MSRTISKEEMEFRRRTAIRLTNREEVRAFILGILSCASVYNFQPDAKMVAKCVRTEVPDNKDAGVGNGHAHRWRDTFAVELLLARVPISDVSVLLGHQTVKVTEKHYNPWVIARQEQLEATVRSNDTIKIHKQTTINKTHTRLPIITWRRGESNPRPRSLATRRLHAYPVPKVSLAELRMGKTRRQLVR